MLYSTDSTTVSSISDNILNLTITVQDVNNHKPRFLNNTENGFILGVDINTSPGKEFAKAEVRKKSRKWNVLIKLIISFIVPKCNLLFAQIVVK